MKVYFKNKIFKLTATGLSASAESVKRPSLRRTASREKSRLHRSSSRRNKENGTKCRTTVDTGKSRSLEAMKIKRVSLDKSSDKIIQNTEQILHDDNVEITNDVVRVQQDCSDIDKQTFHVTLTYKPRI